MSKFDPKILTGSPKKTLWPLSYYSRLTNRIGDLTPVLCKRVIAGDRWKVGVNAIVRLAPLSNPVYDRVRVDFDAFYVQNRIVDPWWKEFFSGGIGLAGQESTEGMRGLEFNLSYLAGSSQPSEDFSLTGIGVGTLFDMLGIHWSNYNADGGVPIPKTIGGGDVILDYCSLYPFLGYQKIYSDWYRNERFQSDDFYPIVDYLKSKTAVRSFEGVFFVGVDGNTSYGINNVPQNPFSWDNLFTYRKRNYSKDPYTTALSEPLIGGPIPIIGGVNEVQVTAKNYSGQDVPMWLDADNSAIPTLNTNVTTFNKASGSYLAVNLANIVGNTVQQLNNQYALYKFFMKDTYNGNRYNEFMESHFYVHIPDSTLERSIFLGRQSSYINFSEIYQTSGATDAETTLGSYAGKGVGVSSGLLFDYEMSEQGYVFILMSIIPFATYFQGITPEFTTGDRFAFYMPEFQNIGDAEVPLRGIWNGTTQSSNYYTPSESVFGYNRRWFDYIWFPDEMHGNFLKLDSEFHWTFARVFDNAPVLDGEFSQIPYVNNPFTYTAEDSMNFYTEIYFDIHALRPINRDETITTH